MLLSWQRIHVNMENKAVVKMLKQTHSHLEAFLSYYMLL